MKFTIDRKTLLRELNLLSLIQYKKNDLPILRKIRIDVADYVRFTRTNLDASLVISAEATHRLGGSCLVDMKVLHEIVRTATADNLDFFLVENLGGEPPIQLEVKSGNARWLISAAVDIAHYPEIPQIPQVSLNLSFEVFRNTVKKIAFAITTEQNRFTLSGIKLQVNGSLRMVSTDGHRLALATVPDVTGDLDVLIPKTALNILSRFPMGEEIGIALSQSLSASDLFFQVDNRLLVIRPLSGRFPDYEMVLPKDHDLSADFDAIAMAHACKQAFATADRRSRALYWDFNDGGISDISTSDPGKGDFKTQVVTNYKGQRLHYGINAGFLLDFCSRQTGVVKVTMNANSQSPLSFTAGPDLQYIVMPLRV